MAELDQLKDKLHGTLTATRGTTRIADVDRIQKALLAVLEVSAARHTPNGHSSDQILDESIADLNQLGDQQ